MWCRCRQSNRNCPASYHSGSQRRRNRAELRGIRRDENENGKPLLSMVADAVLIAGRGHNTLPGSEHLLFVTNLKCALPVQDNVYLVLLSMNVPLLRLPRLETIDVTKEARRLEKIILLHLLRRKLLEIFKAHDFHIAFFGFLPFALRSSTAFTIGSTETKCRWSPRSAAGTPIASPSIWGRCKTGNSSFAPTVLAARSW